MIAHEITGKFVGVIGTMAASSFFIAVETVNGIGHPAIQYGAIGVLGVCAIYVTTKLVPMSIKSRQEETAAFIETLTTEREKLVSSMERIATTNSESNSTARRETEELLKVINRSHREERKTWSELMGESNVLHTKSYTLLQDLSVTLHAIKDASDIEARLKEHERHAK